MTRRIIQPRNICPPMVPVSSHGNDTSKRIASPESIPVAPLLSPSTIGVKETINSRSEFEAFSARDDVPGALGLRELKFVIVNVHTDTPKVYFMDSEVYKLHYWFVQNYLGIDLSVNEFNRLTYFTEQRQFLVGSILAYDNYIQPDGTPGLYALEFWPTDPVSVNFVAKSYRILHEAMPFAAELISYHPSGDVQEARFVTEAEQFAKQEIPTISTYELFEDVGYNPLNLGAAVGRLRVVDGSDPRPPAATDIVIFDTLPNDLPIVAGVITSAPQTSLSHVNLRAQQNGIANAYLNDAENNSNIKPLIGKMVWMEVTPDHIDMREATQAEVDEFLTERRPNETQFPRRNLEPKTILPLSDLGHDNADAFGAKTANVAELRRAINPEFVPDGFAIPFSYYDEFMRENDFYEMIASKINQPEFKDAIKRKKTLKKIRKKIKKAALSTKMQNSLEAMHKSFPAGTTPRCRSSANNEDMLGFTGAGLYDSYTHRQDEGHIEKSIKQVWASLWNLRAFDEREFYRIDHMTAAMGVLVHPNFDDEQVNGVALTRNLYFPTFEGYYINAQVGENLVTNPEDNISAEEVLVMRDANINNTLRYEKIYIRRSSLVDDGGVVISHGNLLLLASQLQSIQEHFKNAYNKQDDDNFAMDVEFKIDRAGKLVIKQARPWQLNN